jgi:hypothetical protein
MNQTKLPDKLVIFDDNDEPQDMRVNPIYQHFFQILDIKIVNWEVIFAPKKGQHHIHQMANDMACQQGFEWVWRVDDDCVPEPTVLSQLYTYAVEVSKSGILVGAVGGSILTPPLKQVNATGKIKFIDVEPNIQWDFIKESQLVEHLHCSFLYRAGIQDFNLGLSRVAHREETLFTYGIHQKGYSVMVVPHANSWHLKNPEGGIRSETKKEMFDHDEFIFRNFLGYRNNTIVVLNCGLGDHIVFSNVIRDIPHPVVFTCYPEIIPGKSIAEAQQAFGDIEQWNIYKKMDQWGWKGTVESAFRKLYKC